MVGFGAGTSSGAPVAGAPVLFVGDTAVAEGHAGRHVAKIRVTLSAPLGSDASFAVQTVDDGKGGATPDVDYRPVDRQKRLRAGATSLTVPVRVLGDTSPETIEQVGVRLTQIDGPPVALAKSTGSIVIDDDDSPSQSLVSATAHRVFEGDAGHRSVPVSLTLSQVQTSDVLVTWKAVADSATPDDDFRPVAKTTRIRAGRTQGAASVAIYGDTIAEDDEQLHVVITNVTGGSGVGIDPSPNSGLIMVVDDDADADLDGLADAAEAFTKSDPADSDTDDDGLTDGYEVRWSFTNPLQADTDGDGFDDVIELKAGTDPRDAADHPFVDWA
jgi:hypothetical protein